jgi:hypothetical protein
MMFCDVYKTAIQFSDPDGWVGQKRESVADSVHDLNMCYLVGPQAIVRLSF